MKRDFEFEGSGFGYLWLCIWTAVSFALTEQASAFSFSG